MIQGRESYSNLLNLETELRLRISLMSWMCLSEADEDEAGG